MSGLRTLVPDRLEPMARDAYVHVGAMTAPIRMRPGLVMVGASRSGTTSLFRALLDHPQIVRPPVNKGVRYFDLNYERPWRWYLGHFPVRALAERRTAEWGPPLTLEASGYYLYHPFAAARLARDLPEVQVVAMLRDPVERAFSAWKHESARGFEWEPFERALDLEDERLAGEVERMAADPAYRSHSHRHQSYRTRGEYVGQLESLYAVLPRSRVHVVISERFFTDPVGEYSALVRSLGLRDVRPPTVARANASSAAPMPEPIRRRLAAHYAPYNERLERLLGVSLPWS